MYSTNDIKEFTETVAKAVLGEFDGGLKKITDNLKRVLENLRPTISYDPLTGNPILSFDWITAEQANTTLEAIFKYLNESKKMSLLHLMDFSK